MNTDHYIRKILDEIRNSEIPEQFRGGLQFDITWAYFNSFNPISRAADKSHLTTSALLLINYLACWGMFRGSSSLKKTNTFFFEHLVEVLLGEPHGALLPLAGKSLDELRCDDDKAKLDKLIKTLEGALKEGKVTPTGTLVSKILMATWGEIPGYDRYFRAGLKHLPGYPVRQTFNATSVLELAKWTRQQKWNEYLTNSKVTETPKPLPKGRLVDLALFQYGYEMSRQGPVNN